MSKTTRTFIALPIPDPLRSKLERLQRLIAPAAPDAVWVTPADFHLTLAFLGDVEDVDLSKVCNSVADAVQRPANPHLYHQKPGRIPRHDPSARVLWAGLAGELEALETLQEPRVSRRRAASVIGPKRPSSSRISPSGGSNSNATRPSTSPSARGPLPQLGRRRFHHRIGRHIFVQHASRRPAL